MEDQLREALKKYEETLLLFPAKPEDDKTAQAKAEIEEAIDTIQDLLKEAMAPSPTEEPILETTDHNRKRKHDLTSKRSIQEHQTLTEYFDSPIDFESLAQKHPEFAKFVFNSRDGVCSMDFTDPVGTLELTKVLLKEHYGLAWDIPVGHLVPPIPCRAKYIAWIHDLLHLSSPERTPVCGLDIGCGANCIYPLLGATMYGWNFVGTDITQAAVHYANANKDRNPEISHLINIVQIPENCQEILSPVVQDYGDFHFCMCNPPFFSSIEEAGQNQRTAFGGTAEEMVYPGGELSFVNKILEESIQLQSRIYWYTVMLGKKSTFKQIRAQLHRMSVPAIRTSTLMQGKITRWTIAWSFEAKNTSDRPLRQICPSSSRVHSLPSLGRSSRDLIHCLGHTIEAHGGAVVSQSETRLTVQLPGEQKDDFNLEILPEGSAVLVVLLPERASFPQGLFQKLWEDVKILWCG